MLTDDGLDLMMAGDDGKLFAATPYTGTGAEQDIFTGQNLDMENGGGGLAWIKAASDTRSHYLVDSARGSDKLLSSNGTAGETTESSLLTSFNASGVTVGTNSNSNGSGIDYVLFSWLKRTGYFDIVLYSGDGVNGTARPHELEAPVDFAIVKSRGGIGGNVSWYVWHKSLVSTDYLVLNSTAAKASSGSFFNAGPSANFSDADNIYTGSQLSESSHNYVNYLFAEKAGFSNFGIYTGSGTVPGIDLELGWTFSENDLLIIKRIDNNGNWITLYNQDATDPYLEANSSNAAVNTANLVTPIANGVRIPNTPATIINPGNGQFIYAAIKG